MVGAEVQLRIGQQRVGVLLVESWLLPSALGEGGSVTVAASAGSGDGIYANSGSVTLTGTPVVVRGTFKLAGQSDEAGYATGAFAIKATDAHEE